MVTEPLIEQPIIYEAVLDLPKYTFAVTLEVLFATEVEFSVTSTVYRQYDDPDVPS